MLLTRKKSHASDGIIIYMNWSTTCLSHPNRLQINLVFTTQIVDISEY
jgi:hypothetical protein